MSDQSTDIVPADDVYEAPVGLEDIGPNDLAMPRLNIIGEEAVFEDSLSNEKFSELNIVVLGLVRNRVLWEPELKEGAKPLCRSRDGNNGQPQADFPWASTGFTKLDDEDQTLDCNACPLKEWGSHPKRDNIPWCTEQFVAVVFHEGGPALLTLQRSSMKAARDFANSFVRSHTPTFTKYATITLEPRRTGSVRYAVPKFVVGERTPVQDHAFYADLYLRARNFLQSTRRNSDGLDDDIAEAAVKEPGTKREPAPVDDTVDPF